jgi:hypothetical protein
LQPRRRIVISALDPPESCFNKTLLRGSKPLLIFD